MQVTELEAELEKLPNEKVQLLKSQQDLKAKMQERAAMSDGGPGDNGEEGIVKFPCGVTLQLFYIVCLKPRGQAIQDFLLLSTCTSLAI